MCGYELDPYMLTLVYTATMLAAGLAVYMLFYKLFRSLYGDRVKSTSRIKEDLVMCGLEYADEELTAPISRVFTDVMRRALPRLHKGLYEKGGTSVLNDWFAWMLIVLFILILVFVFVKPW